MKKTRKSGANRLVNNAGSGLESLMHLSTTGKAKSYEKASKPPSPFASTNVRGYGRGGSGAFGGKH